MGMIMWVKYSREYGCILSLFFFLGKGKIK